MNDTTPVDVVISIVDHDNEEVANRCLASLPAACDGLTWHAIVTENLVVDGAADRLRRALRGVQVVQNRHPMGFGANHNQALSTVAETSGARYLLVLNDDTVLPPGAVRALVTHLDERPGDGAAAPVVLSPEGGAHPARLSYPTPRSALRHDAGRQFGELADEGGWLQGCCLMVRAEAWRQVGGFDERYYLFYEDADLSRRLVDAGWGLSVCPATRITHFAHSTVLRGPLAATTPLQGLRSRYLYLARHRGAGAAMTTVVVGRAVLALRALAAGAGVVGRPGRRDQARRLVRLARYNPRSPIHDERLPMAPTER